MSRKLAARIWQQAARAPRLQQFLRNRRQRLAHVSLNALRRVIPSSVAFGPPKSAFSIYEKLKSGAAAGRVILEQQRAPDPRRTALRRLAGLGQEVHLQWPVFWSEHAQARLVGPTLALLNERKELAIEAAWGAICLDDDPAYRQLRRPAPVFLNGAWTSVVARWCGGFHHWMFDALPRLAVLSEFPSDINILVPEQLRPYQLETLSMLGVADRCRPSAERHLVAERFFFSAPTAMTGHFNPYAVEVLRRMFLPHADKTFESAERVYIRRVGAARGIENEAEVIELLQRRGYTVVDTEKLTVAQQIQLFANAKEICALHGAALTNLVWCQPGCRVVELLASTFLNGVYEGIAEAAGLDYDFLVCPGDVSYRARVDLKAVDDKLNH
jgi:capsular polysaccharide biosynthesis protein